MAIQRFESSVTAVSWSPSEAISGPSKIPFELGVTHSDQPPPDRLEDLEQLRTSDRFREANELRAFVEVDDRQIGEIGPGAVVGERAALMNGKRTATLWARTPGRVASVPNDALDAEALGTLAASRERAE